MIWLQWVFDSVSWVPESTWTSSCPDEYNSYYQRFNEYMSYQITPKFHKTDAIKYLTAVRQRDYLVLILFILNVDPLSFLLDKFPGLTAGNLENAKLRLLICFLFIT